MGRRGQTWAREGVIPAVHKDCTLKQWTLARIWGQERNLHWIRQPKVPNIGGRCSDSWAGQNTAKESSKGANTARGIHVVLLLWPTPALKPSQDTELGLFHNYSTQISNLSRNKDKRSSSVHAWYFFPEVRPLECLLSSSFLSQSQHTSISFVPLVQTANKTNNYSLLTASQQSKLDIFSGENLLAHELCTAFISPSLPQSLPTDETQHGEKIFSAAQSVPDSVIWTIHTTTSKSVQPWYFL